MIEIKPYQHSNDTKRMQVEQMFDNIAPKYDFLNRVLSLGIDQYWRYVTIKTISKLKPKLILDVATGTADLAIASVKCQPEKITGIDISAQMLAVGRTKIKQKNLSHKIELHQADSAEIPYPTETFDATTAAFGVRNFQHLQQGINEMYRVTKKGGCIAVLEFSTPSLFPFKQVYQFYFKHILPLWGKLISKDKAAYTYLPESVKHFPEGEKFAAYLINAGYTEIKITPLTFGVCTLYFAIK